MGMFTQSYLLANQKPIRHPDVVPMADHKEGSIYAP